MHDCNLLACFLAWKYCHNSPTCLIWFITCCFLGVCLLLYFFVGYEHCYNLFAWFYPPCCFVAFAFLIFYFLSHLHSCNRYFGQILVIWIYIPCSWGGMSNLVNIMHGLSENNSTVLCICSCHFMYMRTTCNKFCLQEESSPDYILKLEHSTMTCSVQDMS